MFKALLSRIKAWCFHSLTIAWGYLKILAGVLLLSIHEISGYVGDLYNEPNVKAALDAMNFPAYVSLGLAVIGAITIAARFRTVNKPTDAENQITVEVQK